MGINLTINRLSPLAFNVVFFIFILSSLLDPADKLLGLKVYLFIICTGYALVLCLISPINLRIPIPLIIYALSMALIPFASITHYFFIDGSSPYGGFILFKAYLFIFLVFTLYITKVDFERYLAISLNFLVALILSLSIFVRVFPDLFIPIYLFGNEYGIFSIDEARDYGNAGSFFQMYFVTSSMLVFSIAYYFDKWKMQAQNKYKNFFLFFLSIVAMFIAGTRNNMIMSIVLPFLLLLSYSNKKYFFLLLGLLISLFTIYFSWNELSGLFSLEEASNSTKLTTLIDYLNIFSGNTYTFLFGEGLGSYENWTGRAENFITELTYLELVRSYGLFTAIIMVFLMVYPIIYAYILRPDFDKKHLIIAYAAYLIMSFTNPLFFSSMGMLLLSILMTLIYFHERKFTLNY